VLYSNVIGKDRKELHLWSLILNRLQQRRVDTRKIRRLMHITGQHRALQMELPVALRAQRARKQLYKLHKTQAEELRQAFKLKVNKHGAIKFQTSVETQQKITQNAFKSKNTFSRIRKVVQINTRAAMTYVERADEFGSMIECFDRSQIDDACISEGKNQYSQSHDTPFLTTPLIEEFGFLRHQDKVRTVLDGTYECPPGLDEYTMKFIPELKRPANLQELGTITGTVTTAEHIKGWKWMHSTTSASTFGLSFSELIVGTDDLRIAEVDAAIVSIPARTGYCPRRWSETIDVMIPKKAASGHYKFWTEYPGPR
jgi:hypothetical protein